VKHGLYTGAKDATNGLSTGMMKNNRGYFVRCAEITRRDTMSKYKHNGIPQWKPRQGAVSRIASRRRRRLVDAGVIPAIVIETNVDEAIKMAGLE
jgi:hypothetical protein